MKTSFDLLFDVYCFFGSMIVQIPSSFSVYQGDLIVFCTILKTVWVSYFIKSENISET